MVRPLLVLVAGLVAGCTAPAYTCGHPVPCARGSIQSCTSRDGARCRYLTSDGTAIECAACDDCFAAEREIAAWCDSGTVGSSGGNGSSPGDFASVEPRDMSEDPRDMAVEPPRDLSSPVRDLGRDPRDFSSLPPGDLSGLVDNDLGCYELGYQCNSDPTCCAHCCAGGCTMFGYCALETSAPDSRGTAT